MKTIHGLSKIRFKQYRKPVVILGVFDGVHLAHRRILNEAVKKAKAIRGKSVVLTFFPHPQKKMSLYSLGHRLKLLSEVGIDVSIVLKFTKSFADITAEDFVKEILVKKIQPAYVYVGKNFRFGKNALGNFRLLERLSGIYHFKLKTFDIIRTNNLAISSTYIRRLITKGALRRAERLLGRPVSVFGTVIKGASLAKRLGFATANINPHHEVLPPAAVYAVKINFLEHKFSGVCYIGTKPTVSPITRGVPQNARKSQKEKHVEVHIFGFNKKIYGKDLDIQFVQKIRDERKFTTLKHLAQQVKKDIACAKKITRL